MGDVFSIDQARAKRPATAETNRGPKRSDRITFAEVAEDLANVKIVNAFRRASAKRIQPMANKGAKIDVPSISLSSHSPDSSPYGTLHVPEEGSAGSPILIVTNETFFAAVQRGLETTKQARSVITGYILGLAYWNDLFRRSSPGWAAGIKEGRASVLGRGATKPSAQPQHPDFWQPQDYNQGRYRTQHPILHRAAASLALGSAGELVFGLPESGPYPIHIAALMDPTPKGQLKEVQGLLQ